MNIPTHPSPSSQPVLRPLRAGLTMLVIFGMAQMLSAMPSGGPYGPIQQEWPIPEDAATVRYVAPTGNPDSDGATAESPTTLEMAIQRSSTGDVIILRGGDYRTGNLHLNQGITLQPFALERPVIKGTAVASDWIKQDNGLWQTKWETLFPSEPADWWRRSRNGTITPPWMFNNDMVFVDGVPLRAVGWEGEITPDSFYIDYKAGNVYIGVDPTDRLVEITAFDNAITRITGSCYGRESDKIGPTIRGITFTQYAYRAIEIEGTNPEEVSPESNHGKMVVGTTLEHVTFSHCSRVAAYLRGDKLTVRNCLVSDTGTEGLFILSSSDVWIEKNILRRNNMQGMLGYFPAALKIFNQCYRVTCVDNYVTEQPNSSGIWYDVGNWNGLFINNWIEQSNDGFFFEISNGAICAGNLFVDCNKGVRVLNSRDVHLYHNTFVNSLVSIERTPRSAVGDHFGWHPASGPDVDERDGHRLINNLMVGESSFSGPMMQCTQTPSLCEPLQQPQIDSMGGNLYVRESSAKKQPLILWSPLKSETDCSRSFDSIVEFKASVADLGASDAERLQYHGYLFNGRLTGNYSLSDRASVNKVSTKDVPVEILKKIGLEGKNAALPGAFGIVTH